MVNKERASIGEIYYTVTPYGDIVQKIEEGSDEDAWLFEWGNYFTEESQAFNLQSELIGVLLFN